MTKTVKSVCPYCGVGCGIVLEVSDNRVVKVKGNKEHPTNFGRLCTKGNSCAQAITESGRMEYAYRRPNRKDEPVKFNMDEAIPETARRLRAILDEHGPDALSFYVSGQMSLEAQYLINKLAKGFVRTNNIESNSRLCMASAGSGYKLSLGADGPSGSYQDMDRTDLFFVIGANMADCHPILFLRVMDRVKAGAKLIVVDPRRNATADKASLFMQIRPGTDLALLNGLLHLLVKNGHTDPDFIEEFTSGWEAMPEFLEDYPPDKVAEITGIPEADIRQAALWIGESPEWMSCWTMGLNQSTHGTWHTNAICNLHLATGKICRPGSGPFSLTGQPNAMGGREMGYIGPGLPGQRSVLVGDDRHFIEDMWGIPRESLRTEVGTGTISMFQSMIAGDIKACWIICTNPVATVPNRKNVIAGLQAAELVITQDAFFDTETNWYADIMLPGALWSEAEGIMINSERNLTLMQKAVDSPGEAMSDWQIIARVACEMGYAEAFTYETSADVYREIQKAWNPKTGYDIRGASYERLRETPLQWPCAPDSENDRNPIRYLNNGVSQKLKENADGSRPRIVFATESGKGFFFARPFLPPAEMPDKEFSFVLNTGRVQHQWHTMTKTGKIPTLNKLNPGPFIEIHPEDAEALGIEDKDRVKIRSRRGLAILPAVVTDRVRPGNCFAPFHWNDVFGENLAINAVTNDDIDPISLQPEFKFCAVSLTRVVESPSPEITASPDDSTPVLVGAGFMNTRQQEEVYMTKVDTLANMLGIELSSTLALENHEKMYLAGFITSLRADDSRTASGVPVLPFTAPMEPTKRAWLDGMLAGMFSRTYLPDSGFAPIPTATQATPEPSSPSAQAENTEKLRVTILWASQTGNAEGVANDCAKKLQAAGHDVRLASMDSYSITDLSKERLVLMVASTFGAGDPPDNGEDFWQALQADNAPRLPDLRYAVLGFGDSSYDLFCGFGRNLDIRLEQLGAQRLKDRVDCDTDFEEQANEWIHSVEKALTAGSGSSSATASLSAHAAGATATAATKAHVTILWASQTGNAEGAASDCTKKLQAAGHDVRLVSMDSYSITDLSKERFVLMVASTFGAGDPPDNGEGFWQALQADNAPLLPDLRYAVLAFGDSSYDLFCGFGRNLDTRLEQLGAQRLRDRVDCDTDFEEQVDEWIHSIEKALSAGNGSPAKALQSAAEVAAAIETTAVKAYDRNHPLRTRVIASRRLSKDGSEKDTRHHVFDLSNTGLHYEVGDALGVWPTNCPELVEELLQAVKLNPTTRVKVKDQEISLGEALLRHFEIAQITPGMLQFVQERSNSELLGHLLKTENKAELKKWLWGRQLVDVLQEFPITVNADEFIGIFKPLRPRLYSISSSSKATPDEVHITVSTVRYPFNGKIRKGVCSSFLADRTNSDTEVSIFVQKAAHFRPPANPDVPMIMVGPGTGVGPFRGFLYERQAVGAKGENWLIFGEQRAEYDFYFKEELEAMQKDGLLTRLDTAFSRDQAEKIYVQDRMLEHGAELWAWLQEGAHFYICGDASRMAKEVEATLKRIIQQHGGMSSAEAEVYVKEMAKSKRYARDVY